jgi:adenylate cyclase
MGKYLYPWFPAELETEFLRQYDRNSARIVRTTLILGGLVYCAFYIWDRVIDVDHSLQTLLIRVIVAVVILSGLLIPRGIFVRHLQKIVSAEIVFAGLAHVAILSIITDGFIVGMPGVILVLMYNFVFFRLLFFPSAVGGLIVMAAHEVVMIKYFLPTNLIIVYNFFLVSTLLSGMAVTYLLEGLFRSEFLKTKELDAERAKSDAERAKADNLIESLFPARVALRLKAGEDTIAESHGEATILFSDLVGFTNLTRRLAPGHLVEVLTDYFSILDELTEKHGVEKIKTVGDAYMVASGLNYEHENSAEHIADFALDMVKAIRDYAEQHHFPLALRVGISTGQVVSGVIGVKKPLFDVWGDTVNLASRMESTSEAGQIQVAEATYWRLQENYNLSARGPIEVKGVGSVDTFFLVGRKSATSEVEPRLSKSA